MYGIELLIEEHKNILEFTEIVKSICCDVIDGKCVDTNLLRESVEFGKNYADKHHHGKEEKILFKYMIDTLGTVAEKLVTNGMLVEHDLGRYHMGELIKEIEKYEDNPTTKSKLAIITHASGYADLLERHIKKEDEVCYTFAIRMLSNDDKIAIDNETKKFEKIQEDYGIQKKYLSWLNNHKL